MDFGLLVLMMIVESFLTFLRKSVFFLLMSGVIRELAELFGNRKVDLRTPQDLSRYFREDVLSGAETTNEIE